MTKLYGVLGTGTAPKKAIHAALDDLPKSALFYVPWYGKPTEGLEHLYDWVLDNAVAFNLIAKKSAKIPNALSVEARAVDEVQDVDSYIIDHLRYADKIGQALILWDDDKSQESHELVEKCIDAGLLARELTNALIPIVFDDSPAPMKAQEEVAEDDPTEDFDRPTLENMPAAVVKRMAKDKGQDAKTKDEAIRALLGEPPAEEPTSTRKIVSVVVTYSDGMVMTL